MEVASGNGRGGICALEHCDPEFQGHLPQPDGPEGDSSGVPRAQSGAWPDLIPVGIGHGHLPPGPCAWTGRVDRIVFDRYGEFEGGCLQTLDGGWQRFYSSDLPVLQLVRRAWKQRTVTTVLVDCDHSEEPIEIIHHCGPPSKHGWMD